MIRTLRMPAALVASLCLSSIPLLAQHGGGRSAGHVSVSHAAPRSFASTSRVFSAPAHVNSLGQSHVVYAQSRGGGHATGPSHGTAVVRGSVGGAAVYHGGYYGGYYGHGVYPIHYSYPYYAFHSHYSVGFGIYVGYPFGFSTGFYYGYPYYAYPYYAPPYPYYSYPYPYYPPAPAYGYPAPYGSMSPYPQSGYPDPQQGYPQQSPQQSYPPQSYPPQSYPQQPQQQGYPGQPYPQSGSQGQGAAQPQQNNSVVAQPGSAAGGISFDITPATAAVIIDGTYVGRVQDLGPTTQPMGLKPGRHHVEIRAPGFESVSFDADIVAGQVLPYKGQMQPIR